ncbi:MAG: hypothetical protein ABI216_21650 [Devosia sp.]
MGKIGGVHQVLNWMTGEPVFTHQLPRICREAVPVMLARMPELQSAIDEAEQVTGENYLEWLERWTKRYGLVIAIPKMNHTEHERIDPMSEAAQHFAPDNIIVVKDTTP